MATVLKRYNEINELLLESMRRGLTVAAMYENAVELMKAQRSNKAVVLKSANGQIIHLWCSYHQCYEPIALPGTTAADEAKMGLAHFGVKKGGRTGYAHACSHGINVYAAQKRALKKRQDEITQMLLEEDINVDEARDLRALSEEAIIVHTPRPDGLSFATPAEARAYWDGTNR